MPYLQVLSEFREGVRQIAREKKGESLLFSALLHIRLKGCKNQNGQGKEDPTATVALLRE